MAFLTSQRGSGSPNVAEAFRTADRSAIGIKSAAVIVRDRAVAGTVTASDLLDNLLNALVAGKAGLIAARDTPGIGTYATDQYADAVDYDIAAEFSAMISEVNTTLTWLENNSPADADGNLKKISFVGDGSGALVTYDGFTGPQQSAIETRLNALLATID